MTRITVKEIMTHEWVTMDGFYPINMSTFVPLLSV